MPDDDLTLDRLTVDYRVYQRRKGHRFSSDDMVTAWAAVQVSDRPARILDLGCGLGSVLLHLAWSMPTSRLVGIEAQAVSFALAERNVGLNSLTDRIRVLPGDFRDDDVRAAAGADFDLVTGTPPYFPVGTADDADDEQRMRARIETRGGVEAYLETGALLVAPEGDIVVCGDSDAESRVHECAHDVRLDVCGRVVVIPRQGRPPLFSVWWLRRTGAPARPRWERTLTLRDSAGERTADARMLRAFSGFVEP